MFFVCMLFHGEVFSHEASVKTCLRRQSDCLSASHLKLLRLQTSAQTASVLEVLGQSIMSVESCDSLLLWTNKNQDVNLELGDLL